MARLGGMISGGFGKSGGGAKRGTIAEITKKNPDFMKLDAAKRNELLMDAHMQSAMLNKKSASTTGATGKELSKRAKEMMEIMIKKQLQKRQKEIIKIRACWFGNGRIDSKGRIFDASNKEIGKIDPETYKITIGWSNMGKYKDDSFTLTKLSNKIASMNQAAAKTASVGGMGSFYGTADNNSGGSWW